MWWHLSNYELHLDLALSISGSVSEEKGEKEQSVFKRIYCDHKHWKGSPSYSVILCNMYSDWDIRKLIKSFTDTGLHIWKYFLLICAWQLVKLLVESFQNILDIISDAQLGKIEQLSNLEPFNHKRLDIESDGNAKTNLTRELKEFCRLRKYFFYNIKYSKQLI